MENIAAADIWFGFIIAVIASVSTFMGAMTSLYFKKVNPKTLAVILGFAAGIMLYTAFMKLMPDAVLILSGQLPYKEVKLVTTSYFFFGNMFALSVGVSGKYMEKKRRQEIR